ncbi:MAG TPA: CPBP family glutamic-type intramembrane protease [Chloroflexia bacterium]|nr:CPBP family glutamic-type intramembrane protease [Chloroflexia bacterium]
MSANIMEARSSQVEAREPAGGLRATMQRHPVASYFVVMYAGLSLAILPAILSKQGLGILDFEIPFPVILFNLFSSLLGPLVAGLVMSWVVGGREGMREFRRRVFRFRVGPQWYAAGLVGVPVLGVLSAAAVLGISPVTQLAGTLGGFVSTYLMTRVLVALMVNLWEESGQMAFVTPRLQRSHGPVFASVVVAVTWAFMHLPPLLVPAMDVGVGQPLTPVGLALSLVLMSAYAIPVRFIATWLFNNARRSVVIVALFHAAMNAMQSELSKLSPDYNPYYLIGAFAVVSVVLLVLTRGKLGYRPEQAESSPAGDAALVAAAAANR